MKAFRFLNADEIECRVQRVTEKGLTLLLYKTARTDADLLDETVGAERWENDFKVINGVLYGGIGVDYGNGLVWKWDAGTESNMEADKGRASDAFKRAGFKHGIGRELYTAPFVWIPADRCTITEEKGKKVCKDDFSVSRIEYTDERISALDIINSKTGREVFTMKPGKQTEPTKPQFERPYPKIICERCGEEIKPVRSKGVLKSVEEQVDGSQKTWGKNYCYPCAVAVFKGADNENA